MRNDIIERKTEIRQWIEEKRSKAYICRQLNCKPDTLERYLREWGINYRGNKGGKGWKSGTRKPAILYLFEGSAVKSHVLKMKLIEDNWKGHHCERCLQQEWLGFPIPLELHHEDGNHYNNSIKNLKLLCPNCHALTPNHAGKGKRTLVSQLAEEAALEAV